MSNDDSTTEPSDVRGEQGGTEQRGHDRPVSNEDIIGGDWRPMEKGHAGAQTDAPPPSQPPQMSADSGNVAQPPQREASKD